MKPSLQFKAVAIDHWTAETPTGLLFSIKQYPLGWTLIRSKRAPGGRYQYHGCNNYRSVKAAAMAVLAAANQ